MRLKAVTILCVLGMGWPCWAAKFDAYFGAYSLSAETGSAEGSSSGLGAYKLTYSTEVLKGLQVAVGYSVVLSQTFSGDLGFGLDLGGEYFFLTPPAPVEGSTAESYMRVDPLWRPFVGLSFHQRQFQSVRTNYAGFGVSGGVERSLDSSFDLKAMARHVFMAGPGSSSATETVGLLGLSFSF